MPSTIVSLLVLLVVSATTVYAQGGCRTVPGSANFPANDQWQVLNSSVSSHLVRAIPSGEYCRQINCTDQEWDSANWRNTVPGAMNSVNWEQDFDSHPPSLCWRTTPPICGQGDVPIYAILAENAKDIQAGVNFARDHNLRLSVKASGHDLLGRSTAKSSLLIHTHNLQSIEFTDGFQVGDTNLGSAVTVGSGVGLSALYNASGEVGKIFVGGTGAATVVPAGGYVQGGGHSTLSPLLGMASDNVLEFHVVTADGVLRRVNNAENPDLFWALRGGGAGSWGVIVNATFRTFPTFNTTRYSVMFSANNITTSGAIAEAHARHIFDLDSMRIGQSIIFTFSGPNTTYVVNLDSYFPNSTAEQAVEALAPLFEDMEGAGGVLLLNTTSTMTINKLLAIGDDQTIGSANVGSRLIPESVYRDSPKAIGDAYKRLIDIGTFDVATVVVGGQVIDNANIDSALNPVWRTAKTHIIAANIVPEDGTIDDIHKVEHMFGDVQLPILETIQGAIAAAYSNEADAFEVHWQSVFYGNNYPRLSSIKRQYDPSDLFIVTTGVGSERWDSYGLCRI